MNNNGIKESSGRTACSKRGAVCVGDWWQYLGCASGNAAGMSISTLQGSAISRSPICSTQNMSAECSAGSVDVATLGQSNVFLRCLPAVAAVATGGGLRLTHLPSRDTCHHVTHWRRS